MTKPFTPMELLARVNSQLRRYRRFMERLEDKNENSRIHTIGGLEINEDNVEVTVDGETVKMTPIEYKILLLLVKSPGRVFLRRRSTKGYGMNVRSIQIRSWCTSEISAKR